MTFGEVDELQQIAPTLPLGVMAFVLSKEALYIRVQDGFREALVRVLYYSNSS